MNTIHRVVSVYTDLSDYIVYLTEKGRQSDGMILVSQDELDAFPAIIKLEKFQSWKNQERTQYAPPSKLPQTPQTLRDLRVQAGLTQMEAAKKLNNLPNGPKTTQGTLSQWEKGVCIPRLQTFALLATAYAVPEKTIREAIKETGKQRRDKNDDEEPQEILP